MTLTTLVSTEQLAQHLDDPSWVILDCQHDLMNPAFGRASYAREHIPGARFISLDDDLAEHAAKGRGRHPLPSAAALAAAFSRLGVDANRQVVVYDSAGGSYAARAWWCLRWLGHRAVAVLDGSITKWKSEGKPLTAQVLPWQPAVFTPHPDDSMRVDAAALVGNLKSGQWQVVDARAPERFDGSAETIDPVGGHIPGAANRFWKGNLDSNGTFKTASQLRSDFAPILAQKVASELVHQCGSGVTACHNLLALEVAGLPGGKLYPGSWSEWCADPVRPVATGAA